VTACLEGRWLLDRRSPGVHRLSWGFHTICLQCEWAWQKMSRAIFTSFGKTCHVICPMILAKDVAYTSMQEVTLPNILTIPHLLSYGCIPH